MNSVKKIRFGLVIALVIAFASLVNAATALSDYRSRIQQAIELLKETTQGNFDAYAQHRLLTLLPPKEEVTNEGTDFDVDNSWISSDIDSMSSAKKQADKDKIYDGILNKLKLLASDIDKLQQEPSSTVDRDRAKMNEILNRHEFNVQHGQTFIQRFLTWLLEQFERMFSFLPKRGSNFNKVLRVIITIVATVVVVMLALFLYRYFKRDRKAKPESGKRTIFGEEITEETTAESLADSAKALAMQGDYRGAIRKLYVSMLFELERRGLLRLQPSATNREYLDKIRKQVRIYPPMSYLTERFDYFWYGKFTSSQSDFEDFLSRYDEALNTAPVSS